MKATFSRGLRNISLAALVRLAFVLGTVGWRISAVHASPPGTWTATGSMNQSRDRFSGVLLPSGKVLVAGSWAASNSAELYDPATGAWTETGSMLLGRSEFQAALLANGQVLVAGGYYGEFPAAEAELYNPATGTWSGTGSLVQKRENYAMAVLPNGEVLFAGGATGERFLGVTNSAEIYNPATGSFTRANPMNVARQGATATLLANGKVLVVGGSKFINGRNL